MKMVHVQFSNLDEELKEIALLQCDACNGIAWICFLKGEDQEHLHVQCIECRATYCVVDACEEHGGF